jgi:hypothetical protein
MFFILTAFVILPAKIYASDGLYLTVDEKIPVGICTSVFFDNKIDISNYFDNENFYRVYHPILTGSVK